MSDRNSNITNTSKNNDTATTANSFLKTDGGKTKSNAIEVPSITLPQGGGALKGIDEKFSVNAVNGTAGFSIPLPFAKARGVTPLINLSYNSGSGNGIFGLGWNLSLASIKRKTDKALPQYLDTIESDTFLFSEAEDLVPEYKKEPDGSFSLDGNGDYIVNERISIDGLFNIRYYIPRIEGLFAKIERWARIDYSEIKWRVITRDNTTTLFGWTDVARLCDPNDNHKIYEWLPEFVYDDKGNCAQYFYKKEDKNGFDHALLHNKNRFINGDITYTNIYPEKTMYGNITPYRNFGDPFPLETDYLFSTRLDYGEYNPVAPFEKIKDWDFRADAFSDYQAGFEIRTTRLCKRALLFHHFKGENEYNGLVTTLDFVYDTGTELDFTFLISITTTGFIKKADASYSSKSLPAMEFVYQKHEWNKEIKTISSDNFVHAPSGLDEQVYQFTDLYNEGLAGILTEQANGWYYKHNLGDGIFEQAKLLTPKPSFAGLGGQLQLADLDADGGKQLVNMNAEPRGYFELNDDNEWQRFINFVNLPNIGFRNANSKMLDLTGDGKPEILISEENAFTWYPSNGRKGFAPPKKTIKYFDEETGPNIVFADEKQTIFLANMSGSGLADMVRIRNGEVCYWPNLGYGKFGAKCPMDNAPLFDTPDAFNASYLKLADIDGSGTTDIIYLGKNKFTCWKNLSGNRFSTFPFEIDAFPELHSQSKITVTDLLGNGVACIVASGSLLKDAHEPIKYIDLMGSKKPHIMVFYKNNFGKEVNMEYCASTKFYLEDKLAGKPWVTKLHFPVHCVSKTETVDKISGYRFISSYKYHQGYYDHAEREFRGFGMVEQTDAEHFEHWVKGNATNIVEQELHQEPVVAKTWHHTGAFINREKILTQFEKDYWYNEMERQGFPVVHQETELPEAKIITAPNMGMSLVDNLNPQEWREALRACKGMALRTEVFAKDAAKNGNTPDAVKKELTPYSVTTHNCFVELVQPKGKNKFAVYVVKESEAIAYTYEREIADPRISHKLNLLLDEYGNVLESASVVYPRLIADLSLPIETQQEQNKTVIIYSQNQFTNDVIGNDVYRLRMPSEVKTYELKGVAKTGDLYTPNDFTAMLTNAIEVMYHQVDVTPPLGFSQKRLLEHVRTNYLANDLSSALPVHQLESLAFPFEGYQLAYTPDLLNALFSAKIPNPADRDTLMSEGQFLHREGDSNWWIRSGTTQFIEGAETSVTAQNRFYVPISYTDPYGAKTSIKYYSNYFLFIQETEDALGNKTSVDKFNFRTASPQQMIDINGNISASISDELGLVKAMAVFGKGSEADNLSGLNEFTDIAETNLIQSFFNTPDTAEGVANSVNLISISNQLLLQASARYVYNFEVYINTGKPNVVASIIREQHFVNNNNSPIQLNFEYANGLGNVVMKKVQAAPGLAKKMNINPDGSYILSEIDTAALNPKQLRWIGNGKTILNNKGKPVKQYEPYFSVNNQYEDFEELVETGVTPIMYYDAAGRLIKTEMPDGTCSKVIFDSWKQLVYDANDTVLESVWYLRRTDNTRADFITELNEQQAAAKSAKHADTPLQLHFDTLGRSVLSVEHNKNIITNADEFYETKIIMDVEGNLRTVTDARNNTVVQYQYDMLGTPVYQKSMDAGQRWMLLNILGNPLRTWDERNHEFQYFYDTAHRPLHGKVIGGDGAVLLDNIYDRNIYGESLLLPNRANEAVLQAKNILGKAIQHYDTGGLVDTPEFDFKGKPVFTTRKLFSNYKGVANWIDANLVVDLEGDAFTFTTETDAMGRIQKQTAPDGSIIIPAYNETGLFNGETVTHLLPAATNTYIIDIDYNEKGQRNKIIYGNDVTAKFYYDKETFRLMRLETKRLNNDALQDWYYTFDANGNITHIEDKNIPLVFFNNQKITGIAEYTYDALYRLVEAKGREHAAALNFTNKDNWNDKAFMQNLNNGDAIALRNYTQSYSFDAVGNIMQMTHVAAGNNWTRDYVYENTNNRLMTTQLGALAFIYTHHPLHGYLTKLPHLEQLDWSFKEEIIKTIQQKRNDGGTAETTYYQYDGGGQRIRKITENTADVGMDPTKKEERIYFSGYETYRTYAANTINFERETLSLIDQGSRFIMIETVKQNTNPAPPVDELPGVRLTRYQLHNHLGSAALELDDAAQVISYEEYHPFGTTAYQAMNATIKAAAKRYRFTGMERDEETGLEYHSARYYIPFLGRWCSADPIGIGDGVNVYCYCKGNAVMASDKSGNQSDPPDPQLNFYQCSVYQTNVTATYSSRGISETLRATYTGLYRTWTGDYSSTVDVGHMGTPFVFLRAGDVSPVGPQLSSENRSDGAGAVRSSVGPVRSSGGFARVDGIDTSATGVASKGARYPANPLPASLANPRLAAIGRLTAAPATTPLIVLPASTSGGTSMAAPSGPAQLSFPFAAEESPQMSFNFSRSAPIVNSSSAPPPLPIQTTQASAQLELDFSPAPAPRSGGSSSGGSGGGRSWPTMGSGGIGAGGLGALGRSTPVVGEGVFLTESALMTGAYYTASSAPAVSSALITAAEATPVIAGVGIVGAGGGHVVRYVASEAGASQDTADALGFGGAVAIGAGLGSVVPGVGTAVGAVAGGLVAGGIYLFSIW